MSDNIPAFSNEQWDFLAVLEAIGGRAHIDLIGNLSPLKPGPLFELLKKTKDLKWLIQKDDYHLAISTGLPVGVRKRLQQIMDAQRVSGLLDQIVKLGMVHKLDSAILLELLKRYGHEKAAAELEIELYQKLLKNNDKKSAWEHLQGALGILTEQSLDSGLKSKYLSAVLDLSNLSFALGKGFPELASYLNHAHNLADDLGDQRSHALINLHLGRIYYFSDRRPEAMMALSLGLNEVEELGDYDIMTRAAEFLGLSYYMQGRFKQAFPHLERAEKLYEKPPHGYVCTAIAPVFLGTCLSYLGEFHQAIGSLDYNWRLAVDRGDHAIATTLRAVLGTILVLIRKNKEALIHLKGVLEDSQVVENSFGLYVARGGMGLYHFIEGRPDKSRELFEKAALEGASSGLVRQYSSPWILELAFEFDRLGFKPIKGFGLDEALTRIWNEENIHLKGVALRLLAKQKQSPEKDAHSVFSDLRKSQELLTEAGDPLQLAMTNLEMARLRLAGGRSREARVLVQKAWKLLAGYAEEFFPDDLRFLLESKDSAERIPDRNQVFMERYLELIETLLPPENQDEILARTVVATNRLFGAERGGLFWFPGGKYTDQPEVRAAANLTRREVFCDDFSPSLELILQAFQKKRPVMVRLKSSNGPATQQAVRAVLCLPVTVSGKPRAVLYHDNSYLEDCFDFLDTALTTRLVDHISHYVERIFEYCRLKEERNYLLSEKSFISQENGGNAFLFQSRIMAKRVSQLDSAARSDSSVLLLGETGVGKELLARRLHSRSRRREGPFIIVDATTIPEGLVESELFGHEKGSFTGADRQKRGRLELANGGTLFFDEVGELPISIQAKLLRALQDRTFSRVGGMRTLHSDFRLVAATNRDLAEDVASGRFREDLYYRLNVVPLIVPPLRERKSDIILLARHFLEYYARKYNRPGLKFSSDSEAALTGYHWPGNVREVENVMERAVLLSAGGKLEINLPAVQKKRGMNIIEDNPTLDELQRRYIKTVLEKTNEKIGGPGGAAELLGMNRSTLYGRMRSLGMR